MVLKLKTVEEPAVGNKPLFKVTLCHENCAESVSKTFPSAETKSYISLAGKVPTSISVLSYVRLKPSLVTSDVGYPNCAPNPLEFVK